MSVETKRDDRLDYILEQLADRDNQHIEQVRDLLTWGFYGQDVFSQFGLGLCGWIFRQRNGMVVTSVKVVESGVPLVAFSTTATTRGGIAAIYDRLWDSRVTWQKDKYPWI